MNRHHIGHRQVHPGAFSIKQMDSDRKYISYPPREKKQKKERKPRSTKQRNKNKKRKWTEWSSDDDDGEDEDDKEDEEDDDLDIDSDDGHNRAETLILVKISLNQRMQIEGDSFGNELSVAISLNDTVSMLLSKIRQKRGRTTLSGWRLLFDGQRIDSRHYRQEKIISILGDERLEIEEGRLEGFHLNAEQNGGSL